MPRIKKGSRPHKFNILINYKMKCSTFFMLGHLLYEMLAGYELTTAEPKKEKLVNFKNTPVVEVCDVLICAAFLCFLLYFFLQIVFNVLLFGSSWQVINFIFFPESEIYPSLDEVSLFF